MILNNRNQKQLKKLFIVFQQFSETEIVIQRFFCEKIRIFCISTNNITLNRLYNLFTVICRKFVVV